MTRKFTTPENGDIVRVSKTAPTYNASGSVFLDPLNAQSGIAWNITVSCEGEGLYPRIDGNIYLRDCSRSITWGLEPGYHNIEKLTAAIDELIKIRDAWREAALVYNPLWVAYAAECERKEREANAKGEPPPSGTFADFDAALASVGS